MTEPLTTIEHDIAGLDGFMLNTEKLMASELWALATGDEFKAAMGLWCRAWKQVPAGSLPNDERVLAAFSGAGAKWPKVRDVALRGFILCSDGRLYHKVLCDDVQRAYASKKERHARTKAATEARNAKRDEQRNEQRDVNVTESHRRDLEGKGREEESKEGKDPLTPKPDFDEALKAWNLLASEKNLSKVQRLTEPRKRSLAARLAECGGLEGWQSAIAKVRGSPFLTGDNDRNWRADFDFLLQQKSFTKLMEGGYDGQARTSQKPNSIHHSIDVVSGAIQAQLDAALEAERGERSRQ